LKISRRSFYNIRNRYQQDASAALHPRSSAPITARRTYDESITSILLAIRARLKAQGWEYGPISIRFEGIATGELTAPIPSVSTIACLLRAAGAVESNLKKRPKSSVVRFQRGQAME
ncbi:transposase, partial [Corynebacterium glutamicum]